MKRSFQTSAVRGLLRYPSTSLCRRAFWVALLFGLPLGSSGCLFPMAIDCYDGPERSLKEVAVLIVDMNRARMVSAGPRIEAIDDRKVNHEALEYHLLPGPHTIDFTYRGTPGFGTGTIYTKEPWRLQEDFKAGHVYRIFCNFLGSDPNERFALGRAALAGGTFGLFRGPRGYFDNGLLLLGTVEELACRPELLPNHHGRHKVESIAFGGLLGASLVRPPAIVRAWRQLAEAHCPDKPK